MINRDMLIEYVRIISGADADPNLTLVDFSLTDEKRNIVNLVNETAKNDKKLAELLDDLKYSNNKMKVIDEYFSNKKANNNSIDETKTGSYRKEVIDNCGFVSVSGLAAVIGFVVFILTVVITIGA